MLKLAGEGLYREKIESISYSPLVNATGDLETGTHTIVPTTRPAIGSAQYSAQLTLTAPSDARLSVLRIAARLSANIVSLGTASTVYCSVRVDVDDADHELFNLNWTSTGAKLDAVDTHSGNKGAIFNKLKDGAAHTFYFLFWANAANQAQIDLVELWEGVGSCATATGSNACLSIYHTGMISIYAYATRQGTGTTGITIPMSAGSTRVFRASTTSTQLSAADNTGLICGSIVIQVYGSVATDLNYLSNLTVILRSAE